MSEGIGKVRRILLCLVALAIAAALWLPFMHVLFDPDLDEYSSQVGISPKARQIAARHLDLWASQALRSAEIEKMRGSNAEWDFMGRTYFVLSLANMALRDPDNRAMYLSVMDGIIDETVRLEREHGIYYFLMPYATNMPFLGEHGRSIFQDGEIGLMLGARRVVEEKEEYKAMFAERIGWIEKTMEAGPVMCAESYPNECWMFCNAVGLATLRFSDVLDGTDHKAFFKKWIDNAKRNLVEPRTGLLVSSFGHDGTIYDGPEGSSLWMTAHCLQLVDDSFAEEQYQRSKVELAREFLGFWYAREWPASCVGPEDVDSGPVIPFVEASAGSSGLALVGAAAFGDRSYLRRLIRSLNFGGFPVEDEGRLRYCASNQVGDSVLLYSLVMGPLWDEVRRRAGL